MKEKKDLSDEVEKMLKKMGDMPLIKTRVYTSRDDKYIIQETSIKTIKPTAYYEAIIRNMDEDEPYNKKEDKKYAKGKK